MSGRKVDCPKCYRPNAEHIIGNYIQCWFCDKPKEKAPTNEGGGNGTYVCLRCTEKWYLAVERVAAGAYCSSLDLFSGRLCGGTLLRVPKP